MNTHTGQSAPLQIEYLPVQSLSPYARNSRTHSDEQINALVHAFATYGFNNPVAIDQDGQIIAGHGRVLAAERAGMVEVPCIRLSHLSEAQRRAYVIADNRLAEMGGWDMAILASEVEELLMDVDADLQLADLAMDTSVLASLELNLPDLEPAAQRPQRLLDPEQEDDRHPTADDYADIGAGMTHPGEGKQMLYPVILQLTKSSWQLWKRHRGQRSDSEAIVDLLDRAADVAQEDGDV